MSLKYLNGQCKKEVRVIPKYDSVLLKKFAGEEGGRVDIQKLFGYVGLFTLVALWWLGKSYLFLLCCIQIIDLFIFLPINNWYTTKNILAK